jgi:hypothetical protein
MPIIFVHGVANHDKDRWQSTWNDVQDFLRRYVASEISDDPANVKMIGVYWADVGAQFAWKGKSRPLSPLLGHGGAPTVPPAERALEISGIASTLPSSPKPAAAAPIGLVGSGGATGTAASQSKPPIRLKDLSPDELSNLLSAIVTDRVADPDQRRLGAIAADAAAHDATVRAQLAACAESGCEWNVMGTAVQARFDALLKAQTGLVGHGTSILGKFGDWVGEALGRAEDVPGYAVTQVFAEARPKFNALFSEFLGDIFAYLNSRGTPSDPGEIPKRLLAGLKEARKDQLERDNEPIVVFSHSMGGQIVYDIVTGFLPALARAGGEFAGIRIDFWNATASQVGFFEELKLFLASSPDYSLANNNRAPFPSSDYLGNWWNVWDSNDFISFTAARVFDGVDDEEFRTGMFALEAHSGYLQRPSFYRRFAEKLSAAKTANWNRR